MEELKLSLLAKSCLCPGLVTLIANLIASAGEPPKRSEHDNAWLEAYWHGKGYEVYKVNIASAFHGQKFSHVASKIYKEFRAILFALELGIGDNVRIHNNPGDYTLPTGARITAYVISQDKDIADAITNYKTGPLDAEFTKREARMTLSYMNRRSQRMPNISGTTIDNRLGSTYMDENSEGRR